MPITNYQSGVPSSVSNLEQDSNAVTNQDYLRILRVLREQAALPYANIELDNLQHQIDILTHIKPITVNTVSPSTPANVTITPADDGLSIVVDIPQGADGTQGIQGVQGDSLTFKGVYATLALLQAAFPTGTTGVYVVTADGKWYYWSGTAWSAGGTYQSTGIADNSVTLQQLDPSTRYGFDFSKSALADRKSSLLIPKFISGTINSTTGVWIAGAARIVTENFVMPTEELTITVISGWQFVLYTYQQDGTYVGESGWEQGSAILSTNLEYKIALAKTNNSIITPSELALSYTYYRIPVGTNDLLYKNDYSTIATSISKSPIVYGATSFLETSWIIGTISNGIVSGSVTRIVSNSIYLTENMRIKLLNKGAIYRFAIHSYNRVTNAWLSDSGWITSTEYTLVNDSTRYYKIVLAQNPDATAVTNVVDFASNFVGMFGVFTVNEESLPVSIRDKVKYAGIIDLIKHKTRYVSITGTAGLSPIDSAEAILQSAHCGMFGVEIDIRLTADNNVVCLHSEKPSDVLDVPDVNRFCYSYTVAELKTYKYKESWIQSSYKSPVRLITLDECMVLCKRLGLILFLDIKEGTYETPNITQFLDLIIAKSIQHGIQNNMVFIHRTQSAMQYIRSKLPLATIAIKTYIESTTVESDLAIANAVGGNLIMQVESLTSETVDRSILTDQRISQYHSKNLPVKDIDFIYTFNPSPTREGGRRYLVRFVSSDGGNTWTVEKNSMGLENPTMIPIPSDTTNGYLFTADNLYYQLMENGQPCINIDYYGNETLTFGKLLSVDGLLINVTRNGQRGQATSLIGTAKITIELVF